MKIIARVAVHIAFCTLVLVLAAALHGCDVPPTRWKGVPPGVGVECGGFDQATDIGSCIGDNGIVYTCLKRRYTDATVISCAPRTPVQMPAESPR